MKVLMLIISSDTERVYAEHRKIWSSYMNSNPYIECYFIQYREGPQGIEGNTFWLTGTESFSGILTKTLDSLEYFLKNDYDFIVRTNLSSVWNFNLLLKHLKTLPRENVYNGFIGNHNGIPFVSGSGFIVSPDVATILLKNRKLAENSTELDDVTIGYILHKLGINTTLGYRNDTCMYNKNTYHYRCKLPNSYREDNEIQCMKKILSDLSNI